MSSGSQSAEQLTPWHRPAEQAGDPKVITACKFFGDFILHSWDKTIRVSDTNCRRASGVKIFEFLNADEFSPSSRILWVKPTQYVGLMKWQGSVKQQIKG